jgi:hypothetical protein
MLLDIVFVEKVLLVCVCLRLYGLWWHRIRMTVRGYMVAHLHTFDDWLEAFRFRICRYFYICCTDRVGWGGCHDFIYEHHRNFKCSRQHSDVTQT